MVSGVLKSNGCIFLVDQARYTSIPGRQKKQVILPEIVPLMGSKRAINFRLQGRATGSRSVR
jgi:hypothetical protein